MSDARPAGRRSYDRGVTTSGRLDKPSLDAQENLDAQAEAMLVLADKAMALDEAMWTTLAAPAAGSVDGAMEALAPYVNAAMGNETLARWRVGAEAEAFAGYARHGEKTLANEVFAEHLAETFPDWHPDKMNRRFVRDCRTLFTAYGDPRELPIAANAAIRLAPRPDLRALPEYSRHITTTAARRLVQDHPAEALVQCPNLLTKGPHEGEQCTMAIDHEGNCRYLASGAFHPTRIARQLSPSSPDPESLEGEIVGANNVIDFPGKPATEEKPQYKPGWEPATLDRNTWVQMGTKFNQMMTQKVTTEKLTKSERQMLIDTFREAIAILEAK